MNGGAALGFQALPAFPPLWTRTFGDEAHLSDRILILGQHRSALRGAAGLQVVLLGLCALPLDGGELLGVCAVAVLAFLGGFGVLLCRASRTPSPLDLLGLRFGILPVVIFAGLIAPQVGRLRGVL